MEIGDLAIFCPFAGAHVGSMAQDRSLESHRLIGRTSYRRTNLWRFLLQLHRHCLFSHSCLCFCPGWRSCSACLRKEGGMIHGILYFCAARPFKGQNQGLYKPDQTADSLLRSRCADWRSGFLFAQIQREFEPCRSWHDGSPAQEYLLLRQ